MIQIQEVNIVEQDWTLDGVTIEGGGNAAKEKQLVDFYLQKTMVGAGGWNSALRFESTNSLCVNVHY